MKKYRGFDVKKNHSLLSELCKVFPFSMYINKIIGEIDTHQLVIIIIGVLLTLYGYLLCL